ncbi:MAG: hypothetical protein NT027_07935 [Proteobacteria bacterium]|nr:hypothetical protein [Pseudomonadota bacterium]
MKSTILALSLVATTFGCTDSNFGGSNASGKKNETKKAPENSDQTPEQEGNPIDESELLFSDGQILSQDPNGCHWTPPFRREVTNPHVMNNSPQSCSADEYMAGVKYSSTSGADDGIAGLYCCKIPPTNVPAFQRKSCKNGPQNSDGKMHICESNSYLSQIDYAAKMSANDTNGFVIPTCCSASDTLKIKAAECKQSEWFGGIDVLVEKTCDPGFYVNGIAYSTNKNGGKRGAMQISCCKP